MQQMLLQRHVQQAQQQQQQQHHHHHQQQQQHQHQQQQQHQQQHRDGPHILNGTSNGIVENDQLMRQNTGTANALAAKMYEEKLKVPLQRDSLDDAAMKQRFGENMGQLMDPNHASILKSAASDGQPSGQMLHGTAGGMSPQVQARNQQLPGSTLDIKTEMNPILNPRTSGPEGSLMAIPGSNQGGSNLTLKGWPFTGLDQL